MGKLGPDAVFCAACRVSAGPSTPPETRPGSGVSEILAAIEASRRVADRRGRSDLGQHLDQAQTRLTASPVSVVVVGEFKRGKSTFINALLQAAVCPVDADVVTAVPTTVRWAPEPRVSTFISTEDGTAIEEQVMPISDLEQLVTEASDPADPHRERSVEVGLPHRMLRSGLRLVDTPGVGGLDSAHGSLALGALRWAQGVLFVTDAAQELTGPELSFLRTAVERCPLTALVVTKIDLYPQWRRMVELDAQHLARAGLELPIIPVSSFLRLRAAHDPDLNAESGFGGLVSFLARDVFACCRSDAARTAAREVAFVAQQWARVPDQLTDRVSALLQRAVSTARTPEVANRLAEARDRLHGPLRLAIAGKVKAGKSALLNAILGEDLAPTDAGECTKIVTWYQLGRARNVVVHPRQGPPQTRPWSRDDGALEVDLGPHTAADIDHIEVSWPTSRLQDLTVMDTPGIASISADISARTHQVLSADDGRVPVADAVLYLMRHTHASDVRFLESFHDDELAHGTPMNSVGVLSRADEIGSCRLDALQVADRIAQRYQSDPRLRRLCPIIIPVDGLLAHASTSLREAEFALLATVARASAAEMEELLLSVDRFISRAGTNALTELERRHLLERFGLFGVRLSVDLIRSQRVSTATELARGLAERSGLNRLRVAVLRQFEARSRVLKARSALAVLTDVLRDDGCSESAALASAVEQLTSGTHEFEEVRLLSALRSGSIDLKLEQLAELDRILGGSGHDSSSRLGLELGSDPEGLRRTALSTLATWQRLAEHPLTSRSAQVAARTATRTLEGIVAASYAAPEVARTDPVAASGG